MASVDLAPDGRSAPVDRATGSPALDDPSVPRSGLVTFLVAASFLGVAMIEPELGANYAWVDFTLAVLIVIALFGMRVRGSAATATFVRASPWLWLILIGSMIGLVGVGVPEWAISSLSRTTMAIAAFFCMWHLLDVRHTHRAALAGLAAGLAVTTVFVAVLDSSVRASGLFPHANYAAHFAALAGVVLVATTRRWSLRIIIVVATVLVLLGAGSFGGVAMVLAAVGVVLARWVRRNSAVLAVVLVAVAAVGFLATLTTTELGVETEDAAVSDTLSQERFERSQGGRIELWSAALDSWVDDPTGVGPDGVRNRAVAEHKGRAKEVHADALGYLVERGVPGIIGFVGLWVVLWRAAPHGGLARVVIAMMITAGIFRETMHYRHAWLILALAFVLDHRRATAKGDDPPEAAPTGAAALA